MVSAASDVVVIGLVVVVICSVVVVWSFDGLEAVVSVFSFSVCFAVVAASDTVVWLETSLAASSGGARQVRRPGNQINDHESRSDGKGDDPCFFIFHSVILIIL